MKRFKLKSAKALKLPRLTSAMLGIEIEIKADVEDKEAAASDRASLLLQADAYLANFAEPDKCPGCSRSLGGFLGTFTWGIQHGEGHCANCGYPCRAHHDMGGIKLNNAVMPYHPDVLEPRKRDLGSGKFTVSGVEVEVTDLTYTDPNDVVPNVA